MIQHKGLHVAGRLADGDHVRGDDRVHGAADGGLGGAVAVHDVGLRVQGANFGKQRRREYLGPHIIALYPFERFPHHRQADDIGQEGGGAGHHIHPVVRHQLRQGRRVMDFFLGGHADGHAVGQGNEFLHNAHVEGDSCQGQGNLAALGVAQNLAILGIGVDEIYQVLLGQHHALGLAGGAGGEYGIGQLVRRNIGIRVLRPAVLEQFTDGHGAAAQRGDERASLCPDVLRDDHHLRLGVLDHGLHPFIGIVRGDGQNAPPALRIP